MLCAPFGPGVYQLRNRRTGELVLFGVGENAAERMTSLLPDQVNSNSRDNKDKQDYVKNNLSDVEYRTMAFEDKDDAKAFEAHIKKCHKDEHIFKS